MEHWTRDTIAAPVTPSFATGAVEQKQLPCWRPTESCGLVIADRAGLPEPACWPRWAVTHARSGCALGSPAMSDSLSTAKRILLALRDAFPDKWGGTYNDIVALGGHAVLDVAREA